MKPMKSNEFGNGGAKEVFNFFIMLGLAWFVYGLTSVREAHPEQGWGMLYVPLIAFIAWWGNKIKEDYE